MRSGATVVLVVLPLCGAACDSAGTAGAESGDRDWSVVHEGLPGALMSVWGTRHDELWAVGADADGAGPLVLHYDGLDWRQVDTGQVGDLLWVFGFPQGPIYFGGSGGMILRLVDGAFERMTTPGSDTVFGIWGAAPDDVWAVGGAGDGSTGAFAWRLDGDLWRAQALPDAIGERSALWKVFGRDAANVWLVGTTGVTVHWDGAALDASNAGGGESLFTVHANGERFVTVGGFGTGTIFENADAGWVDVAPPGIPPLVGVSLTEDEGFAVGQFGSVYTRTDRGWTSVDTGVNVTQTFHAVFIDDAGGVWAVGGDVLTRPLVRGLMLHGTRRAAR